MTVQAIDPAQRRRSFGKLSVQIAVWIFIVTWVLFVGFTIYSGYSGHPPKKSQGLEIASSAIVIELALAPVGHLVGLVLGVMALFRAGDRRGLAVVGILLNIIVVAIGVVLAVMAASGLAPR
jgi:hypothetical protein